MTFRSYLLTWLAVLGLSLSLYDPTFGAQNAPISATVVSNHAAVTPNLADQSLLQPTAITSVAGFQTLAAGDEHACGLTTTGGVQCWGDNANGQVGDGTDFPYRPPVAVVGLTSGVQAVAAGGSHSCALLATGALQCWGRNESGQLGDGSNDQRLIPVNVLSLASGVAGITAGGEHTCARLQSGAVNCWGANASGQLGNGGTASSKTPVVVSGLAGPAAAIVTGRAHSCALLQSGAIQCWGDNLQGQLGNGTNTSQNQPVTVINLGGTAKALAAGRDHTCAILTDGSARCWGDNARGQLGDDSRVDRNTPVAVEGLSDALVTVGGGQFQTCALAADGDLHCWGSNNRGQLGDGTLESSRTPVRVIAFPSDAKGLAVGTEFSCALDQTGKAFCWGSNRARQLGQGAPGIHTVPILVNAATMPEGGTPISGIPTIAGGRYHSCLITPNRGVQCWGRNSDGQLGDGTTEARTRPINVPGLTSGVVGLALGAEHSCALLQSGSVKCWGGNEFGQLGDGTTADKETPSDVNGLPGAVAAITAGDSHTCALLQSGGVKCWGLNSSGQLGDSTTTNSAFPVDVAGLSSGVAAISAGTAHSCARLQSGGVKCWGDNSRGQLGDNTLTSRATPGDVTGLAGAVVSIDMGDRHSCAALTAGSVFCWGANNDGQLGNNERLDHGQPVAVTGLSGKFVAVSLGASHSCGLNEAGGVFCWGGNETSQLGDGSTEDRATGAGVSGLGAHVVALQAGGYHTCVLVQGNRPLCWGRDSDGQLATGTLAQSSNPIALSDPPAPSLTLNYGSGQPGSTFTLIGSGFPLSSTLPVLVNGVTLTDTIAVNPSGEFIVYLESAGAEVGSYALTLASEPPLSKTIFLQGTGSLHNAEGAGVTVALPSDSGEELTTLYLPILAQ